MGRHAVRILGPAGRGGVLGVFTIFAAFPFAWMLITAFKRNSDLYTPAHNPFWFNEPPTLEHLQYVFTKTMYAHWIVNTAVVGVAVVAITLLLALPAGYSLSRFLGAWGGRLGMAIFLVYLVPPTLLFIPLARVVSELGLANTVWALIVVYPTITVPFATWLLMGFFKSIPRELEEQALVDGYGRLGAFLRVTLPLAVPGIITVVVFSFTLSAQEFVYALTFVTSTARKTVSVGVPADMVRGDIFDWGPLMASAFLASVPVAALYYVVLDKFVSGFTSAGALR
ncbi:MAG: carbohydrate ABC transporter permease [Armatimonadota bacterium]|nr:carbohydrate ABC transporter permease [Armatimonadota bacterium]MDR7436874.1 carbohydrate ABC transporter permease [Armatimonadota bacterium]MDR7471585.1 carbohydrate ABC transporter permease [Armatimonadota bacterium]MDR7507587.1 carbohydrate ABC transporter permease [Armatimonadota bacterium]MDR7509497.1 carbohydrate ABC transporter permease [Armatimonadota bacterium]